MSLQNIGISAIILDAFEDNYVVLQDLAIEQFCQTRRRHWDAINSCWGNHAINNNN